MTPNILLDSGAWSAHSRGQPIDLHQYIAFAKRHQKSVAHVVNLDVIPTTPDRAEAAAAASHNNQQVMKDAGLTPIACFRPKADIGSGAF